MICNVVLPMALCNLFIAVYVYSTAEDGTCSITGGLDNTNMVDDKKEVHIDADEKSFLILKDTFLDSENSIRQDIHERFKKYFTIFVPDALNWYKI